MSLYCADRCKLNNIIPMCIKDSNTAIPINTTDKKTSQTISTSRTKPPLKWFKIQVKLASWFIWLFEDLHFYKKYYVKNVYWIIWIGRWADLFLDFAGWKNNYMITLIIYVMKLTNIIDTYNTGSVLFVYNRTKPSVVWC